MRPFSAGEDESVLQLPCQRRWW